MKHKSDFNEQEPPIALIYNGTESVSCKTNLINHSASMFSVTNSGEKKKYKGTIFADMASLAAKQQLFLKEVQEKQISCPIARKELSRVIFENSSSPGKKVKQFKQVTYSSYIDEIKSGGGRLLQKSQTQIFSPHKIFKTNKYKKTSIDLNLQNLQNIERQDLHSQPHIRANTLTDGGIVEYTSQQVIITDLSNDLYERNGLNKIKNNIYIKQSDLNQSDITGLNQTNKDESIPQKFYQDQQKQQQDQFEEQQNLGFSEQIHIPTQSQEGLPDEYTSQMETSANSSQINTNINHAQIQRRPLGLDLTTLNSVRTQYNRKFKQSQKSSATNISICSTQSVKEKAEVLALPLFSTTIFGMGLFASSKLLSGKMQLLGLVPGLMMGIAAYLKTRKIEQELDEYDDTDSDYEIEEIDENGKNQF